MNFSFGGLHIVWKKDFIFNFIFFESTPFQIVKDFDVMSFYVEILLKLFQIESEREIYDLFQSLKQKRNMLKKEGFPLQGILKIIILSITGNLNNKYSPLQNKKWYYSMTANGQLFLAETLSRMAEYIDEVVLANTDGICARYPSQNEDKITKIISEMAQNFGFVFDFQEKFLKGVLLDVNSYVFLYENPEIGFRVKGFQMKLDSLFVEFLKFYMKSNVKIDFSRICS
jgi:DNA polymerase elongation subunit (family B)